MITQNNTTINNNENKLITYLNKLTAKYKIYLKKNSDYLILEIKFNKELLNIMQGFCINEVVEFIPEINNEIDGTYKRYKIKTSIHRGLYYRNSGECLFIKSLIDEGVLNLTFDSINHVENFIRKFSYNLNILLINNYPIEIEFKPVRWLK